MALERPYPQAIAGVPVDYGFDADSRRFTLRYTTTLASGRQADATVTTTIHVPARHYPDGYAVRVHGGTVISAINSRQVQVRADPVAAQVTVTITPPPVLAATR